MNIENSSSLSILERLVMLGILQWFSKTRDLDQKLSLMTLLASVEFKPRDFWFIVNSFIYEVYKIKAKFSFEGRSKWTGCIDIKHNSKYFTIFQEYFLSPVITNNDSLEDTTLELYNILTKKLIINGEAT